MSNDAVAIHFDTADGIPYEPILAQPGTRMPVYHIPRALYEEYEAAEERLATLRQAVMDAAGFDPYGGQ